MRVYEFINLIYKFYSSQIPPDDETGRVSAKLIYDTVITWFTDDSMIENDLLKNITNKNQNFCAKVLNESNDMDMPIKDANLLVSKITSENFVYVHDDANLTEEAEQSLVDEFELKGYEVDKRYIPQSLTDIFIKVLRERSSVNKKGSIRKAEFIADNRVKIGGQIFDLPPALRKPELPAEKENEYVTALFSVFSQKTSKPIMSIDDLDDFPIYQREIQIHREHFYSAESVLYKVRDFFYDAESEFATLKDEIFDAIWLDVNRHYPDAYEKLTTTMNTVAVITLSKSYFSKLANGIVGIGEKKGVVHMLVNDGKVRWL